MKSGSLRLRLLGAGVLAVVIALAAAALGLSLLFERHAERRVLAELSAELDLLAAGIGYDENGVLSVIRPPADPRLAQPFSGYYWQVRIGDQVLRSRSLWDSELSTQDPGTLGALSSYRTDGPAPGEQLTVAARSVILPDRLGNAEANIAVAINREEIIDATAAFRTDLLPYLALVGALILAAAFAQVTIGLRPLRAVRQRLAAIKDGSAERLGKGYPQEVQPLVDEVDALLDAADAAVDRARSRASDLAHALKTPLQILAGSVERLRSKGDVEAAENVEVVATAMRRVVEHELARSRAIHGGSHKSVSVSAVADQVLNVIQRTPQGDRLAWRTDIDPALAVRVDDEALTEALGNVLENAARHAKATVSIAARSNGRTVTIEIVDDGDGIAPDRLHDVLQRGVRLDERGSGLGLAIVAEIASAHGGTIELENAEPGLAVKLAFPKAD